MIRIDDKHLTEDQRRKYITLIQMSTRTTDLLRSDGKDLFTGVDWKNIPDPLTGKIRANIMQIELSRMILALQVSNFDEVNVVYESFRRNVIIALHSLPKKCPERAMIELDVAYVEYFVHLFMAINDKAVTPIRAMQSLMKH